MIVKEGLVELKISKPLDKKSFYNPAMHFDRDLMILFLRTLKKKNLKACDSLAACGARGIRIVKEVEDVDEVWLNDISKDALSFAKENVRLNKVEDKVKISREDAAVFLSANKRKFDYIDIDPFGSPIYYFDGCARAIKREGYIGFSATDKSTLCGVKPITCLRRYGIFCFRTEFEHEVGIRNILAATALTFSRYMFGFLPIFSYNKIHYYRVYGYLKKSRSFANKILEENIGILNYCPYCLEREFSKEFLERCKHCGEKYKHIFPTWIGKLGDSDFVKRMEKKLEKIDWFKFKDEITGLLRVLKDEFEIKKPYFNTHKIAKVHKVRAIRIDKLVEKLKKNGFKASRTHFLGFGIKTNADIGDLLNLFKN